MHDLRFTGLIDSDGKETMTDEMSTFREARAKFEKEYLLKKIAENGGNISKTAEFVGMERSALHRKLRALGVSSEQRAGDMRSVS